MHLSYTVEEGFCSLVSGNMDTSGAGQVPYDICAYKEVHIEPGTREDIPKQRGKLSTDCKGSSPPCEKMFQDCSILFGNHAKVNKLCRTTFHSSTLLIR